MIQACSFGPDFSLLRRILEAASQGGPQGSKSLIASGALYRANREAHPAREARKQTGETPPIHRDSACRAWATGTAARFVCTVDAQQ